MKFSLRRFALPLICGVFIATTACSARGEQASAQANPADPEYSDAGLLRQPLSIQSGDKEHRFTVEMAITGEQQAQGLMFRKELAPDAGMLFPFPQNRVANFWMKNTVIPLDIIFIRSDGTIESIAANTVPYSLDGVRSGEPVAAVLELAGGRAAELALKPGDVVSWQQ